MLGRWLGRRAVIVVLDYLESEAREAEKAAILAEGLGEDEVARYAWEGVSDMRAAAGVLVGQLGGCSMVDNLGARFFWEFVGVCVSTATGFALGVFYV